MGMMGQAGPGWGAGGEGSVSGQLLMNVPIMFIEPAEQFRRSNSSFIN